jgi:CheY-like chemotaxis protein
MQAGASPLDNPLRVLVVDDNADGADALATLLGLWGHSVAIARGGQAGIDIAEFFRPQVMLLDIQMPGMHGGKVARHFRRTAEFRSALIIAITANHADDNRLDEWLEYFDAVLGKPCNLARLEDLLAVHVAGGR